MNPIKLKLNLDYFLGKAEKLVNDEIVRLEIQNRRTDAIIANLKEYIHDQNIINDDFWGYGIEWITNGLKKIEQSTNPFEGYLFTFFKVDDDSLKFYFIRLNYNSGKVDEILSPLKIKLQFIDKTSYSTTIPTLYIYSQELDEPLKLKVDNVKNAQYYSGEIPNLKREINVQKNKKIPLTSETGFTPQKPKEIEKITKTTHNPPLSILEAKKIEKEKIQGLIAINKTEEAFQETLDLIGATNEKLKPLHLSHNSTEFPKKPE